MNKKLQPYSSPKEWKAAAISRVEGISKQESETRQKLADTHNRQNGTTDLDALEDQQLYICGKMDIEEYQDYLLFKHSKP